jgi:hypothetical protein
MKDVGDLPDQLVTVPYTTKTELRYWKTTLAELARAEAALETANANRKFGPPLGLADVLKELVA